MKATLKQYSNVVVSIHDEFDDESHTFTESLSFSLFSTNVKPTQSSIIADLARAKSKKSRSAESFNVTAHAFFAFATGQFEFNGRFARVRRTSGPFSNRVRVSSFRFLFARLMRQQRALAEGTKSKLAKLDWLL